MSIVVWLRRALGMGPPGEGREYGAASTAVLAAPRETEEIELDEAAEPGWWVPRGLAVRERPAPVAHTAADEALYEALRAVFESGEVNLPVIPGVAQRGLVLLQDENVEYQKLAQLVGEDQAIASEILRVVNSAAYARLFQVNQLETAFTRLGRETVRSILLAMTLKGMAIRVGGHVRSLGEELWQRSLVSAVVVSELGRRHGVRAGEAFLVGLLHDLGELAILRVLHERVKRGAGGVPRGVYDRLSYEWHERLGQRLAEAWRLPDPLPAVIGDHHQTPEDGAPLAVHRLLVQFADVTCGLLSFGPYVPYDFFALPCVERLGLRATPETYAWLTSLPALIADRTGVF